MRVEQSLKRDLGFPMGDAYFQDMHVVHDKNTALDQALALFWEKGFASTSLKDLERATGMHPGSIYSAFGSKAGLYCQSLERYATELNARRQALLDKSPSPLEALAQFILEVHPLCDETAPLPSCFLVKATLESGLGMGPEAVDRKISQLLEQNDAVFEAIFQAAIDHGELPPETDPKHRARQLSADLAGLCFYALRCPEKSVIRDMVTALAARLRAPQPTQQDQAARS